MKHNSSSKLLPLQGSKTEDEGGTKSEGSELKEENDVTQAFTEVEFHESHPLKKKKTEVCTTCTYSFVLSFTVSIPARYFVMW